MPILALNCRSQVEQVNFLGNNSDDDSLAQAFGSGVRLYDGPDLMQFILVGLAWSFFICCLAHLGSTVDYLLLQIFSDVV